jgi:hypothetical protein
MTPTRQSHSTNARAQYASREIGDDALSARLASEAGIPGLGEA